MAEKDDFDDWLDDVETDDDGELDQLNIDALLNAVEQDPEADDTKDTSPAELDQSDIDALLGLDSDSADTPSQATIPDESSDMDELSQDNIDALLNGTDDDLNELGQDDIDALLNGTDDDLGELDQDNIDALLSGNPPTAEDEPLDDLNELDQNSIDDLLAGNDDPEEASPELGQDDIDDLFSEVAAASPADAADEPDKADEADQDDIDALFDNIDAATSEEDKENEPTLNAEAAEESAFDSEFDEMDQLFSELEDDTDNEEDPFQTEEIDFAEMLDGSGNDEFLELAAEEDNHDDVAMPAAAASGEQTAPDAPPGPDDQSAEEKESKKGMVIPAFIGGMSKATMSAIGGGLTLLLMVGLYIILSSNNSGEITIVKTETMEEPQVPENSIPLAKDHTYAMDNEGSGMAIELQGVDQDGQPLTYNITTHPTHGRLSGTSPHFTYLANLDFPGKDSFQYTAHDGMATSASALITITGPDLKERRLAQKQAEDLRQQQAVKKVFKPKLPVVLAKNVHLQTTSTTPLTIDWRGIWKESNKSDYVPQTHVDIVATESGGTLTNISGSKTVFTPDPYAARTDLIYYRFKKDGFRSATKTIAIDIELGNPAPEINFAEELQPGYTVGQNVQIDVSPSRDDSPDKLQFTWAQTSGTPVSMEISPENGCRMGFIMPSSFYNEENAGPAFTITATDKSGKATSKHVKLKTISRRQAALWRGRNGDIAEEPAMRGQFFPWPYNDQ